MTCVYTVVALVALAYLVAPLIVKVTLKLNTNPIMTPLDQSAMPAEVRQYFAKTAQPLELLEFEAGQYFLVGGQTPGSVAYVALWRNDKLKQACSVVVMMKGKGAGQAAGNSYSEFLTQFGDDFAVLTNNSQELSAFAETGHKDVVQIPDVESVSVLHRVHSVREHRLAPRGKERYLPARGLEMAWFRDVVAKDIDRQVGTGYFETDGSGVYAPTVKGAYLMTWGQMPPMKQLRNWRRNEKAEKELAAARGK